MCVTHKIWGINLTWEITVYIQITLSSVNITPVSTMVFRLLELHQSWIDDDASTKGVLLLIQVYYAHNILWKDKIISLKLLYVSITFSIWKIYSFFWRFKFLKNSFSLTLHNCWLTFCYLFLHHFCLLLCTCFVICWRSLVSWLLLLLLYSLIVLYLLYLFSITHSNTLL